ncbi:hypothetical protein HK103_003866 [Boothiomyces macroporosus]|uniref:Regulatory factor Sgt1 n=1 Tax=Boothiomyces macroporosus TaxID=261099 RepID=A0AAD5UR50_9FUNG|nr:hypothetical protein HK103_003866 [Boothiomyces macroporosus]
MSNLNFEIHNAKAEEALLINLKFQQQFPEHIWQNEPFHVKVKDGNCLEGSLNYGDAIEDEWIVVYFLRQLSVEEQHYIIKIWDSDGEFLLIEAAEFLPKDINPEIIDHRVYIHKGHLHLIPLEYQDLTLEKSIQLVSTTENTRASVKIEEAAFKRIENYPSIIKSNIHHANVMIPHLAAHLLHHCPQLVAPAVEAFYNRDASTMKPCMYMKAFKPSTNVPMTVRFTKVLYSKLYSVPFVAPQPFNMPPISDSTYEACNLGMKLACGFEILYHSANFEKFTDSSNTKYVEYINRLESLGYFRGEIQGSALYTKLEKAALNEFLSHQSENQYLFGQMQALMEMELTPVEDIPLFKEDSNDWMSMDPSQVDDMLKTQATPFDENDLSDLDKVEEKEFEEMKAMLGGFNQFISKKSGVKGALLPSELDSDDSEESDGSLEPVSFNADNYMNVLSVNGENDNSKADMDVLYAAMDEELRHTEIGKDFESIRGVDGEDEIDVDLNLMKNMLESFSAQNGLAGPTSNLIGSLGLNLPKLDKE